MLRARHDCRETDERVVCIEAVNLLLGRSEVPKKGTDQPKVVSGFRIGGGQGMIGQPKSPSGIPPYTVDGLVAA